MAMNNRTLRPSASGFNPASISGIANWWDGNDAATLTLNSGAVETWTSKAGLKTAASQSTANNRPVTITVNGKTALSFDGVNDGLDFTGTARTDETWVIAAAQTANQDGTRTIVSENGNGYGIFSAKGGTRLLDTTWGGYTDGVHRLRTTISSDSAVPFGPGVISVLRSAAGGGFMFLDGVQRTSIFGATSFSTSPSTTLNRIGYLSSNAFQLQGWIAEILLYDRAISATERQRVERYLGKKWGITVA